MSTKHLAGVSGIASSCRPRIRFGVTAATMPGGAGEIPIIVMPGLATRMAVFSGERGGRPGGRRQSLMPGGLNTVEAAESHGGGSGTIGVMGNAAALDQPKAILRYLLDPFEEDVDLAREAATSHRGPHQAMRTVPGRDRLVEVAKEDPGFFDGYSKKSHEEWAEKAKSQGHDELAKAKRASE